MAYVPPYTVPAGQTGEPNIMFQVSDFALLGRGYEHDYGFDWWYHQGDGKTLEEALQWWNNQDEMIRFDFVETLVGGWDEGLTLTEISDLQWWLLLVMLSAGAGRSAVGSLGQTLRLFVRNYLPKSALLGMPIGFGLQPLQTATNKVLSNLAHKWGDRTTAHIVGKWVDKLSAWKGSSKAWQPERTAVTKTAELGSKLRRSAVWRGRIPDAPRLRAPDFDWDPDKLERDILNMLRGDRYLDSHEIEEMEGNMPYNRRTGQWYPARRRGGYGYRRSGGYRRGGYGYGNYNNRRRTYRRW